MAAVVFEPDHMPQHVHGQRKAMRSLLGSAKRVRVLGRIAHAALEV